MQGIERIGVIAAMVGVASSAGCGTITVRSDHDDVVSPIYLGTRFDGGFIALCVKAPFTKEEDDIALLLLPFALIDLPLSLVADTLLLPVTIQEHYSSQRRALKELVDAIEDGDLARAHIGCRADRY